MEHFSPENVLAMATEHPWNDQGYYTHRPYAHNPAGLNGGLLLFNFTRLAESSFATPHDANRTVSALTQATRLQQHPMVGRRFFNVQNCAKPT